MNVFIDLDGTILDVRERMEAVRRDYGFLYAKHIEDKKYLLMDKPLIGLVPYPILTKRRNYERTVWQLAKLDIIYPALLCVPDKYEVLKTYKDAVMIGDSDHDIISANLCGHISIGVTTGVRTFTQMRKLKPTFIKKDIHAALCIADWLREYWESTR